MRSNGTSTGAKPTRLEHDERCDYVAKLMVRCLSKYEINRLMRERFGVCARTVENYRARVKETWAKDAVRGRDQMRSESLAFYESIQREPKVSAQARIRARQCIDVLFGLIAPTKHEVSGPGGLPIQTAQVHIDMAAVQRRVAEAVEGEERMRMLEERGLVIVPPIEGGGNGNGHNGDDPQDG